MMKRKLRATMLAMAFGVSVTPYAAQAETPELACVSSSYADEDRQRIPTLLRELDLSQTDNQDPAGIELAEFITEAIMSCESEKGWGEQRVMFAFFYELGRLMEAGYRASGELSLAQLRALDNALARGDTRDFWNAVEQALIQGMGLVEDGPTEAEILTIENFIVDAGFDEDDEITAEKIGILVGMMHMQTYSEREFLALEEGGE